jgi:poly-gamma-glutamate capsule biosynthesis protein CapA/YwtB (metallophosphatase superfamily)
MRRDRKPQNVDGSYNHRPRSTVQHLAISLCFLFFIFTSCQPVHSTVTLALLGDINLGRGVTPSADSLAYLSPQLETADLALANLESPLANDPPDADTGTGYNLCASAERAALLPTWGLDLLSIANNHRCDCGPDGSFETVSLLTKAGLHPIGPGMEAVTEQVNGLDLAFLTFDDVSSLLDTVAAAQAIRSARTSGALVIVSVHWGAEYQGGASERQEALAQQFAQAGAALIWGHHPHVLQPAKWIETTTGKTLVLYSLGNALFDQGGLADTRQSALVTVTLDADGVQSVQGTPFVIDVVGSRLVAPDAETAGKIRQRLNLP